MTAHAAAESLMTAFRELVHDWQRHAATQLDTASDYDEDPETRRLARAVGHQLHERASQLEQLLPPLAALLEKVAATLDTRSRYVRPGDLVIKKEDWEALARRLKVSHLIGSALFVDKVTEMDEALHEMDYWRRAAHKIMPVPPHAVIVERESWDVLTAQLCLPTDASVVEVHRAVDELERRPHPVQFLEQHLSDLVRTLAESRAVVAPAWRAVQAEAEACYREAARELVGTVAALYMAAVPVRPMHAMTADTQDQTPSDT